MDLLAEKPTAAPKKLRAINSIVGFCAGSGALFGGLAFIASPRLYLLGGRLGWPFAVGIGAITGLVCSMAVVPLLLRRESWRARPIIAWGTALVLVVSLIATSGRKPWPFFAAPLIFLGFAWLARTLLPAVSWKPGCCARCDYDLRGSLEVGRCPECGLPIGERSKPFEIVSGSATGTFAERTWTWLVRHPLIPILLLTLSWILNVESIKVRRTWRAAPLVRTLNNLTNQTVINLSALTSFDWDTVFIYGPYAKLAVPTGVKADTWKRMMEELPHGLVDEGEILFVFVQHHEVVEHFRIGRWADVGNEIAGQAIPYEEAKFDVDSNSPTGRWTLTRPLYCTPFDVGVDSTWLPGE